MGSQRSARSEGGTADDAARQRPVPDEPTAGTEASADQTTDPGEPPVEVDGAAGTDEVAGPELTTDADEATDEGEGDGEGEAADAAETVGTVSASATDGRDGLADRARGGGALPYETLTRFRDGDVEALGQIYDRYCQAAWTVAMTVTRSDHLAQEAVQEAFLRAWRSAGSYDPDRDLGPWLFTITRYTAVDLMRRELRPTRGGHEPDDRDTPVESPGIDQAWLAWAVREALGRLADHEREVVRLSFFEDLTHAQIAERLDLPLGTVKSRSHRAHRRLAELLAHVREDQPSGLLA